MIDAVKYRDILSALKLKKGEPCEKGAQLKQWALTYFNLVRIGDVEYVYTTTDGQNLQNLPVKYSSYIIGALIRINPL